MPQVDVSVSCPVHDSFRVQQVAGLFDVPLAERAVARFTVDVPDLAEDWQIGLIVGPSGSGKSTIARAAFADCLYAMPDWPAERAVVDGFPELPTRTIIGLLTAVGFSSPPAWVKPYHVLSGGERFRCDLARALATAMTSAGAERPLVVFDEFTSVVDRQVAQVGSAAIAKAVRGGLAPVRFVAVGCHYDVAEWLEPDWVLDMATLDAAEQEYQTTFPQTIRYAGLRDDVELDGAIQQITFEMIARGCTTTISRNDEQLQRAPSYKEKRALEKTRLLHQLVQQQKPSVMRKNLKTIALK